MRSLPISTTFGLGALKLEALCDAANLTGQKKKVSETFHALSILCKERDLNAHPRWSGVMDDCTPFEFSIVVCRGQPRIRILVEAQDDPPSPLSYWNAGKRLNEWFAAQWRVDLQRYHYIEDLFVPTDPCAYLAMWHAIDFREVGPPLLKLYVNPMAQGVARAKDIVAEALVRLEFQRAWPAILSMLGHNDQFTHFSLDLSSEPKARIKVYIRHRNVSLAELDSRFGLVYGRAGDDWSRFCRAILGDWDRLWRRPILACYHLTRDTLEQPSHATLYLPLFPYVENDRVAHDRIRQFLRDCGLPFESYSRCVGVLAASPLESEQGIHSFVAYQGASGKPQVTAYFNARLFYNRYGWLALSPKRCWPSPVDE